MLARKVELQRRKYGGGRPAAVKGIMRCLGVDLGHVLLPLTDLTSEEEKQICQDLIDMGFIMIELPMLMPKTEALCW
ncbi:hypothetical protein V1264_011461 [Littorina saxatilis]|uniref:Uncharacterized protein n=1 Tax=Littorina saxatilis TaxID=31220 RepID=A0AAN9BSW0_9CAEN